MKSIWLLYVLVAAPAGATLISQTQKLACLDANINQNNCSSAASGTLTAAGESISFTNYAATGFGIMHVGTSNNFTVAGNQAWSYGYAAFQDVLTVNSPGHQGQTGFINLGYIVDGIVSSSGISDAFNQVVMRVCAAGVPNCANTPTLQNWVDDIHTSTPAVGILKTHLFQITYGTPFTLYFSMQATGGTAVDTGTGYNFINKTGSGTSLVDFINTFTLSQLTTLASDQSTILNDTNFSSESATGYTQQGVVPEPGTVGLFCVGLAMLGAFRPRRRSVDTSR